MTKQLEKKPRCNNCPICKTYLVEVEHVAPEFAKTGVGIIAVSNDPEDRASGFTDEIGVRLEA